MFRIRFHGRGGQGMKTASHILGTAFFLEGYEVQDAPRYGAERRGAPIFAYVRADKSRINERGIINHPDLVIVADDTLVPVPAAGIIQGLDQHSVLLINSHEGEILWRHRLNTLATILLLPASEDVEDRAMLPYIGTRCAAAAACLLGVIGLESVEQAISEELAHLSPDIVNENLQQARQAYELMQSHRSVVNPGARVSVGEYQKPAWVDLPFEQAEVSAPAIHAAATSMKANTGTWRTMRPVIEYDKCSGCWWVCSTFCPDGAINVTEKNLPDIDYEHCKGCLVCVAQCPPHAIVAIPEHIAIQQQDTEDAS